MDRASEIRGLLSVAECHAVLDGPELALRVCVPAEAANLAERLLSVFPHAARGNNPGAYVTAIAATLARYPLSVSRRACSITDGLPSYQVHFPTIADVVSACEREAKRQREIRGAAQWMLDERKRREELRRQEAEAPPPEYREAMKSRVDRLAYSIARNAEMRAPKPKRPEAPPAEPSPIPTDILERDLPRLMGERPS